MKHVSPNFRYYFTIAAIKIPENLIIRLTIIVVSTHIYRNDTRN